MGGKTRAEPVRRPDPKTGELVTDEQIKAADEWVARHAALGGRELVGDEVVAAERADAFRRRLEERFPWPTVSDDIDGDTYVAALKAWRVAVTPLEQELRRGAAAATKTATAIRHLMEVSADDDIPDLHSTLQKALDRIAVYKLFTGLALRAGIRKGSTRGDVATEVAALLLYCKGISKRKIAKLLGKDRKNVRGWLSDADPIVEPIRDHLGLGRHEARKRPAAVVVGKLPKRSPFETRMPKRLARKARPLGR